MSRKVLMGRQVSVRKFVLFGALLMVVYLWKDFIDIKNGNLQEDVRVDSQRRAVIKKKPYNYSWPKCEQNVAAARIPGFERLSANHKDVLYYRHCRNFPILLDIPDKCGGAEESEVVFLLLVIKSSPENYERREVLRKTWATERLYNGLWIRRIFISGTMKDGSKKERTNKLLQQEQQTYNDILQWDFNESFFNLTLKQVLFLQWLERNCQQARFLLNGDEDVFVNTDRIVHYLQSLKDNDGSKHLFTGNLITNGYPEPWLPSKYYVPKQLYASDKYPLYCGGGGFLMSVHTALVVYNMSMSIDMLPIDDVYFGMCLAKANLKPLLHTGVKTHDWAIPSGIDRYDPCYMKEMLIVHNFIPSDIFLMWHRLNQPNLKCGDERNGSRTTQL